MRHGNHFEGAFDRMKGAVHEMWKDIHQRKNVSLEKIDIASYCRLYQVGVCKKEFFMDALSMESIPNDAVIRDIITQRNKRAQFMKKERMKREKGLLPPTPPPTVHIKETKICTKCKRELPISEFYSKNGMEGGQSHCKECVKAHGRLRNGTTGVYREEPVPMPIALFSDLELMDEAKKRGLLTTDLAIQILKDNGIKGELHQTTTYTL